MENIFNRQVINLPIEVWFLLKLDFYSLDWAKIVSGFIASLSYYKCATA